MLLPSSLTRIVAVLAVLVLGLSACSKQLSQEELLGRAQQSFTEGKLRAAEIDTKTALQDNPTSASGRKLLGEIRLRQRKLDEAAVEFSKSLDAVQDPEVAILYAESLLGAGQPDKLVELYEESFFDFATERPAFLALLARAQVLTGDTFTAAATLDSAIALAPGERQVQLAQALVLARHASDMEGALQVLRQATVDHPEFADAWSMLGTFSRSANEMEDAVNGFTRAVELNKFRLGDRINLVAVLVDQEKYTAATRELDSLQTLIPNHPSVNYAQARIAMSEGNKDRALEELAAVLNVAPQHLPSVYLAANANYQEGNFDAAESHLTTFLKAQPRNVNGRQLLAGVYLEQGQAEKATTVARKLVQEFPMDTTSLKILALALSAQGMHAQSAEVLQDLIEITPDVAATQMELGTELSRAGDLDSGIQALQKAKTMAPSNTATRARLVMAYSATGDQEGAARELEQYRLVAGPSDSGPDELAGLVALRAGDKDGAAEHFSRALELDAASSSARQGMALLAMQDDDTDEAVAVLKAGLEVDPGNLQSLLNLAAVYEKQGAMDSMAETLEEAMKANPEALEPRLMLARYHFTQDRAGTTVSLLTEVREQHGDDPRVQQMLVGAFLSLDDSAAAVSAGRRLVQLLPDNPVALRLASQAERANGDLAKSEDYLRRALAVVPTDVETRKLLIQSLLLQNKLAESSAELALMPEGAIEEEKVDLARGQIALSLGNIDEAEKLLRKSYETQPSSQAVALLNVALMRQGRGGDAVKLGESWLESHPEDLLILRQIGSYYIAEGRTSDAIETYEELNRIIPDDAVTLNNLAWMYRKSDNEQATKYVDRALALAPDNGAILDTKAMISLEGGKYEEALAINQQALDVSDQHYQFVINRAQILSASGDTAAAVALLKALLSDETLVQRSQVEAALKAL